MIVRPFSRSKLHPIAAKNPKQNVQFYARWSFCVTFDVTLPSASLSAHVILPSFLDGAVAEFTFPKDVPFLIGHIWIVQVFLSFQPKTTH